MSIELAVQTSLARPQDLRRTDSHPDHWYPIAWSRELKPGSMLARRYAGEPIAVVRTKTGEVFALEKSLRPSSGAADRTGVVQGCTVRCGYHGLGL